METFSALLVLCAGNSPVTGEFPSQRPVTLGFDIFLDLRLNKRLSKQSRRRWFETPSSSLWRHCNVDMLSLKIVSFLPGLGGCGLGAFLRWWPPSAIWAGPCPACRTYEIATRFWVVVICPIIKCLTVLEFSFILFDFCYFITIFNFVLNYVLIVTFWIFTYHNIWILLIIYCFIWNYWIIYF